MATEAAGRLFRSADLLVRKVGGHSPACCVVTFDSFTDDRTLDRPGFGEQFLRTREIDAIHVISRDNDWYQYPEIPEAMACVHVATRGYARVVAYGSSMGAYAAIRFAGLAGAHCALALSPQFSIDPAAAPFEFRWPEASARFKPLWEGQLGFPALDQAYVAYDPLDLDMYHVALLAREFRFSHVALPNAGHPVTGYLMEVGLLQAATVAVCQGEFNPAAFAQEAQGRRNQSPQYFATLAGRSRLRSRRIALLREAVRIGPRNAGCKSLLAGQLGDAGRFEEALAMHREALAIEPGHPNLLLHHSYTAEASGDLPGALAIMEEVAARTGGASPYMARLLELRRDAGGAAPTGALAPARARLRRLAARFRLDKRRLTL